MVDVRIPVNFLIDGTKSLYLHDITNPGEAAALLKHRVLKNPNDLRSHVRRILLSIDQDDDHDLEGALTDLFIVLQSRGLALKDLLLGVAETCLSESRTDFLRQHRKAGFEPWDTSVSNVQASVLALGFSGTHELVVRGTPKPASEFSNPVEEARSCLEYGQVDAARDVLERALEDDPTDELVASELLEIYIYTNDMQRRAVMRNFLEANLPSVPPAWYD